MSADESMIMRGGEHRLRVIGLPSNGHAYQDSFYAALEARGAEVVTGYFAGRWLLANVHAGDIVHLHWPSFFYASPSSARSALNLAKYIAFLIALRLRGARIVWTAHNLYPHQSTNLRGADALARYATIRLSERIFAHGSHAVDAIIREFGVSPSKIVSIPLGNWVDYFPNGVSREGARQKLSIAQNARVLLFFGGLEPYKNLPLLLRAFEQAQEVGEELWIVGRCKDEALRLEILQAAARIAHVHVEDRYVADEEIQFYMRAADTAVLPYRDRLTCGAAMLALSYGVPVIAPRIGCFSSIVDANSGLLYESNSSDGAAALADALRASRHITFDARMIRDRARQFKWEDAADNFVRALQRG